MTNMTTVLTVSGAILAYALAVVRLIDWWRDRTFLRVDAHVAETLIWPAESGIPAEPHLWVYATNAGKRAITVRGAWFTSVSRGRVDLRVQTVPAERRLEHGGQAQATYQGPIDEIPPDVVSITVSDTLSKHWHASRAVLREVNRQLRECSALTNREQVREGSTGGQ